MKIYIAADHAGFELKSMLTNFIRGNMGFEVEDCGAATIAPSDDYPAIIARAAKKLSSDASKGIESRAVLIGASGQGEAIAANRFKKVRCALYYGPAQHTQKDLSGQTLGIIESTREHNNANALALGARFVSPEDAVEVVRLWLETGFSGESRHARRNEMLDEIA